MTESKSVALQMCIRDRIADSGYGQGQILMNPVQMTSIYSSFMNDGKMMTPHVVKSTETSVWAEPFSKETTDEIKSDLIQVVEDNNGTAHALNNSQYQLAAKTGTGEIKDSQAVSYTHLDVYKRQEQGDVTDEILAEYANPDSEKYQQMLDEICKRLKFTSLRYHRLDDLIESIGIEPCKLCTYCWDGKE